MVVQIGQRALVRSTDGSVPQEKLGITPLPLLHDDPVAVRGVGFELRSCYQIGDSKRIQADVDMALALRAQGIAPIMLVLCTTSLRDPIARLSKEWNLYVGLDAFAFIHALTGFDLLAFMEANAPRFQAITRAALAKL